MSGVVDEYRVHLIHDREVVAALYHVFRSTGHVIAQVIKAEFVVGAVGDVGKVGLAAGWRIGVVLVNAVDRQSGNSEIGPFHFRVAFCEVIVHGHNVNALTRRAFR